MDDTICIADFDSVPGLRDITHPHFPVEILVSEDGRRLWVNVGPVCVLRIGALADPVKVSPK